MLAGGITAGMQDTWHSVSRLLGKSNLSIKGIKWHPDVDQVSNAGWGFVDQYPHCLFIA